MAGDDPEVELSEDDVRVVARFAAACAQEVLPLFTADRPDDPRPQDAIDAAWVFVGGAPRTKLQRTAALDAHRAAKDATTDAASDAARAAGHAAAAAYLHPLAKATQVKHILGAAAHAARAVERAAGDDHDVGAQHLDEARRRATPELVAVLRRYPAAPAGGNRVAALMRQLDTSLRE